MITFLRSFAVRHLYPLAKPLLRMLTAGVRFSGTYPTWQDARARSTGYDNEAILKRVADAALKVNRGDAAFERDSVLFDEIQYSWPVIAGLMWIAAQRNGRLNVVDFGGSLGSSYVSAGPFLTALHEYTWSIVEQKDVADAGRNMLTDDHLHFYEHLDDCLSHTSATSNALLLSSVLQYLPQPYTFLDEILIKGFPFILIDRTPFSLIDDDRITVQKVPPSIYPASYPAWILNLERFKLHMGKAYVLVAEYTTADTANIPVVFKGFLYRIKP